MVRQLVFRFHGRPIVIAEAYNGVSVWDAIEIRIEIPPHIRPILKDGARYLASEDWSWVATLEKREGWQDPNHPSTWYAIVPVYGDVAAVDYHCETKSTTAYPDKWSRMKPFPWYESKEEALAAKRQRERFESAWRGVLLRYGSDFYGESRDMDALKLYAESADDAYLIERVREAMQGKALSYAHDVDTVRVTPYSQGAFERLAMECAANHYPELHPLTSEWMIWEIDLGDALVENAQNRMEIAARFPCDFTLRKALFAQRQMELYQSEGIFADTKSKIQTNEEERRLLYHEAGEADLADVYQSLFGCEMPKTAVAYSERNFAVVADGKVYVSAYSSNYGWNKLEESDDIHWVSPLYKPKFADAASVEDARRFLSEL